MGNQCDCATMFTNKDLSKSKLNDTGRKNSRQRLNKKNSVDQIKYFPDSLSPAVHNAPPEGNEKIELFLGLKFSQPEHSLYNLRINSFSERVDTFYSLKQTEIVQKSTPVVQFTSTIVIEYFFEVKQRLKFEIVEASNLDKQYSLGNVITSLSEIVGSKMMKKSYRLDLGLRGVHDAELVIRAEKVVEDLSNAFFEIKGADFGNYANILKLSNPQNDLSFKICRMVGETGYAPVYKSDGKSVSLGGKVEWKSFPILLRKLCGNDFNRPLKITVVDGDFLIGEAIFTLNEVQNQDKRYFKLNNPFLKVKVGSISISKFDVREVPTFIDYIKGGLHLNAMLAIDFTGSNGDPTDPDSLHCLYTNDEKMNEYQRAIKSVCEIILDYDYDKRIPLFGFGARREKKNFVEHCFPLNGDEANPEVNGLDEIMSTYKGVVKNLTFSGPTLFTPIMMKAIQEAEKIKANGNDDYLILMILTDGQIHDMATTINCLIKAAFLPLSVIIVGVGKADFGQMVVLDGDDGLESEDGRKCERDLVQFVAFRDFQGIGEMLAKSILEEIPNQVVQHFYSRGIKPNLAIKISDFDDAVNAAGSNVFTNIIEKSDAPFAPNGNQGEFAKIPIERLDKDH